jgi:hypothetical protein
MTTAPVEQADLPRYRHRGPGRRPGSLVKRAGKSLERRHARRLIVGEQSGVAATGDASRQLLEGASMHDLQLKHVPIGRSERSSASP